jgi:DNA polymerase III subunit gamma/tau
VYDIVFVLREKNMSHITFYRKYRSNNFDEIVGQPHIIGTLKNAINHDRLAQAYIFSGSRGTGKTSTARILAKALNCRKGKTVEPCLVCDICERISKGQSIDVVEIDAASNTGVDNIRVLNEQVNFATVECLYRIYIIDEVHMLSTGAFNALLKTLEEPPSNTIFILATTEPQKIPATIHSRCQHLHFRKMKTDELVGQLKNIAKAENLNISDKSLQTIARNADGCMRDAISLLDQIYSFKGHEITQEDVLLILGAANFDRLYELLENMLNGDSRGMVTELNKLFDEGINVIQLVSHIVQLLNHMLFVKLGLADQLDLDEARELRIKTLADLIKIDEIVFLFEAFSKVDMELKWFPNPELFLQVRFLVLANALKTGEVKNEEKPILEKAAVVNQGPRKTFNEVLAQKGGRKNPDDSRISTPVDVNKPAPEVEKQIEQTQAVNKAEEIVVAVNASGSTDQSFSQNWQKFLELIKLKAGAVFAVILNGASVVGVKDKVIYLKLKQDCKFYKDKIKEEKYQELINALLKEVFGKNMSLEFADDVDVKFDEEIETVKSAGTEQVSIKKETGSSDSMKINQLIELFEGTLV